MNTIRKMITFIAMLAAFTMPVLAHAEENPDMSNLSDEQMMQELNKRLEEKTNDSAVHESGTNGQPVRVSEKMEETFDSISFQKTVDSMSKSRVTNLIDSYATNNDLSKIEKEKLAILEDKLDELEKEGNLMSYAMTGAFIVFVLTMVYLYKFN